MSITIEDSYFNVLWVDAVAIPSDANFSIHNKHRDEIFKSAGARKLAFKLLFKRGHKLGDVVVTSGLKSSLKWILHTICLSETEQVTQEVLRKCYENIITEAEKCSINKITIPVLESVDGTAEDDFKLAYRYITELIKDKDIHVVLSTEKRLDSWTDDDSYRELDKYIADHYIEPEKTDAGPKFSKEKKTETSTTGDKGVTIQYSISKPIDRELKKRLQQDRETFCDYLIELMNDRDMTNVEVYKSANISRQQFSRILSRDSSMPSKKTIFALAIALKLTLEETEKLLKRAGHAITENSRFDVIISFFIEKGIYDIFTINEALYKYNESLLGSGF